jgi:hypothetical protein
MFRVVKPEKIIEKRGERSRQEIVDAAGGKLTNQALYAYEKGLSKPSPKVLPYLLKGLNTTFDEISEPVELALS